MSEKWVNLTHVFWFVSKPYILIFSYFLNLVSYNLWAIYTDSAIKILYVANCGILEKSTLCTEGTPSFS